VAMPTKKNHHKLYQPEVDPRLYDLKAAAQYLSSTVWFLRQQIWNRQITFLKLGNKYVFDRKDLDAFIECQKTAVAR
jgi:excisionase family DNA binding protein